MTWATGWVLSEGTDAGQDTICAIMKRLVVYYRCASGGLYVLNLTSQIWGDCCALDGHGSSYRHCDTCVRQLVLSDWWMHHEGMACVRL